MKFYKQLDSEDYSVTVVLPDDIFGAMPGADEEEVRESIETFRVCVQDNILAKFLITIQGCCASLDEGACEYVDKVLGDCVNRVAVAAMGRLMEKGEL